MLIALIFVASQSTYPVHATGGGNETGATVAPGGASLGSAGSGTNVTQSDCLPHNATTRGSLAVDAGDATATAANDTTTTFAPQGAGIGANDTSASNATTRGSLAVDAGDATATAANDTTTTFAPQGAGIGANDTSASNATAGNTITANDTTTTFAPQGAGVC